MSVLRQMRIIRIGTKKRPSFGRRKIGQPSITTNRATTSITKILGKRSALCGSHPSGWLFASIAPRQADACGTVRTMFRQIASCVQSQYRLCGHNRVRPRGLVSSRSAFLPSTQPNRRPSPWRSWCQGLVVRCKRNTSLPAWAHSNT